MERSIQVHRQLVLQDLLDQEVVQGQHCSPANQIVVVVRACRDAEVDGSPEMKTIRNRQGILIISLAGVDLPHLDA